MKWHNSALRLLVVTMLFLIVFPATVPAEEVIIYPGYIAGQITTGTPNAVVRNISVSASGNGYSSSRSVTGNSYSLTVQGGDWNDTVNVSATASPTGTSYPYTNLSFSPRVFPVHVGETVTNDYTATGTIRFQVNITGAAYTNWTAYGYATKSAAAGQEQTSSNSRTYKSYSPDGTWDMPVVPNDQIRIYAQVVVDNQSYLFWYNAPGLRYENIAPDQTIVIPLDVVHNVPHCQNGVQDADETGVDCGGADCSACYVPPVYEYGTVQGNAFLDLTIDSQDYNSVFNRHYIYGYAGSYVYTNPGAYVQQNVRTGTWTYRARTYFADSGRNFWFYWPYTDGDPTNDYVTVYADQTSVKDFSRDAGMLTGHLKFTGTMKDLYLNSSGINIYGPTNFYVPGQGYVRQITYGGSSSNSLAAGSDGTYRFFLTQGPWLPYSVNARNYNYDKGYYSNFQLSLTDYNYYYDGNTYDFGQPAYVTPGTTVVQEREYCTGALTMRFSVDGGGLLSSPYISGSGNRYNANGKRELAVSITANSSAVRVDAPELDVHGPTADYTLSTIRAVTEDGSRLNLKPVTVKLECGVWKGRDVSGPDLAISDPTAGLITNASSVTVTGTASDDTGVTSITINEASVPFTPTGNPNAPNEVAFSYALATTDGENTILVKAYDAAGHTADDSRKIYVDRWIPAVTVHLPADGAVFVTGSAVPVSVQASDKGYGFTLNVYEGNELIHEGTGPANDTASEAISFSSELASLSPGTHTISAVVSDRAGNSASAAVTFTVNTPPTVTANGPYTVDEGGTVAVSATGSDPEGGTLVYAWDLDNDGTYETTGQSVTFSAASLDGPAGRTIAVKAVDDAGFSAVAQTSVSVVNVAPTAVLANASGAIGEGGSASLAFSNQYDPGVADTAAGFWYSYDCTNDGTFEATDASEASFACSYTDNGVFTAKGRIKDKDGASTEYTVQVTVSNIAPTAVFSNTSGVILEGGSADLVFANQYDPGAADTAAGFRYSYDCTSDGTFESTDSSASSFACQYPDNGAYTANGRIQDRDGGFTDYPVQVIVNNVAPTVSVITAPIEPNAVNATLTASALFTDPGVMDTHSALWEWGDNTISVGIVEEANGSGTVSGSHAYTAAGVYTIKLTVIDKDGGSGSSVYQFVVVYDPSGGFITGGGWIASPAGAYTPNPSVAGKVNFGFVAKYHSGAAIPGGQTEFNLSTARMNFHSERYEWLVVDVAKAQYKGAGTINGSGNYGFMVTVIDGNLAGGGGVDAFRIKIWDKDNSDTVIYDNQPGLGDDGDPASAIEKGSIVIHKKD